MVDRAEIYRGTRFRVVRVEQTMPDGQTHSRDIVRHPGAVTIVPLLDDGRICLIRNYRVSVGRRLIELPAGTLEPGEDPAVTARRELLEETGYQARHLEPLLTFYTSPGVLDELMWVYVASGLTPGRQDLDAGEQIETLPATWDEVRGLIKDGQISDAKTLASLLYYERFRQRS